MTETINKKYWRYYKENRCLGMTPEESIITTHKQLEEDW